MAPQTAFLPERQFHVLVNLNETEHSVAVLPNEAGNFLVIDQGRILGQVAFDDKHNCVYCEGELDAATLAELNQKIKEHTEYTGLYQ